jgi:hypothetical protein
MVSTDTLLANAQHCVLAYRTDDGPAMMPAACWSDGGGLWLTVPWRSAIFGALRRDPHCAVWIGPPTVSDRGVAIDGNARIYDLSDPVGLALHAATISAAMAALALTHGSELAGYVRDLPRLSRRWPPRSRALIRIRIDRARTRLAPQQVTGVGPVLPTEVPSGVRRALTGVRHVTLALQRAGTLTVQPAVWSAGFQVDVAASVVPDPKTPACIAVVRQDDGRPSRKIGLMLRGTVDSGFRFRPVDATWWEGLRDGSSELRDPLTPSGIVLPD